MALGTPFDSRGVRSSPSEPEEIQRTGTSFIQDPQKAEACPRGNEPTTTTHLEVNGKTQRSHESLSEHSRQETGDDGLLSTRSSERHLPSHVPNPITIMRPASPNSPNLSQPSESTQQSKPPHLPPSSPGRQFCSSPRMHSPASSQIFERDVQEDIVPSQTSPAIPSHIMTENHIPPILEASSAALTNDRLDPDAVEIVTHNSHQAASLNVAGAPPANQSMTSSWHEEANPQPPPGDMEDSSSTYGNLDSADIRRLSFISFADVVHGEHAESVDHASNRNSLVMGGLSTPPSLPMSHNRSPSPVRSPTSSHGPGTPPPTSASPGVRGASPNRGLQGPNSPLFHSHSPTFGAVGGELNVETMSQALRRTESGDLSGFRSQPLSAVGSDDRPFK